jgi:flagellar M-ring protein FliF
VQLARVHLVLPESTLFRRDRQEARASVSLKLEPGVVLQNAQIFGIQRLVAAAVPGLEIGRVVVTDQHGITLSASDALTVGGATGEGRLTMKREVEEYVTRKIVALLDRTYGPGRAIVSVDATLNFDEVRRTVQDLLPPSVNQGNVRRRRQSTGANVAADPASGFESGAPVARGVTDTEYDYGRSVEQVVAAPGGVTRLSVGVIVPGSVDGQTQNRIEDMVRVAAGISEERGDVVVVQSLDGMGTADFAVASAPVAAAVPVESETAPAKLSTPVDATAGVVWWRQWYVSAGLVLAVLVLLLMLAFRGDAAGRLSSDERAQLLADVKASLERGPREHASRSRVAAGRIAATPAQRPGAHARGRPATGARGGYHRARRFRVSRAPGRGSRIGKRARLAGERRDPGRRVPLARAAPGRDDIATPS